MKEEVKPFFFEKNSGRPRNPKTFVNRGRCAWR